MTNPFQTRTPRVSRDNKRVRIPQREAFAELENFARESTAEDREAAIILPVGCGKSGCIALAPFAFKSARALVVAPGVTITTQLQSDLDPTNPEMFYLKSDTLPEGPHPEPAEIRGRSSNRADLDEAHVVVTNIQQLQGANNRWLQGLPSDFFDLILFDEGHHNVADSWRILKEKFPAARIVNFSATPLRADGQLMSGRVIYSYSVFRAIQEGYVKRLKAVVLNPRTLRYVRHEDAQEIEVSLDEVRRLGEEDAGFRRSILTSTETLNTIVDASIRQLLTLRVATGEKRLKIIAAALNYDHCRQVVEAYRSRGQRADYVHSREDSDANQKVLRRLENNELDVIVQVRKLGEGFDHPFLAVAAVFTVFSNLSPFVQFVGRIMRVIKQDAPGDPLNHGVVVFHAGANVASRWEDFQSYSEADKAYFDQLLPIEGLDFSSSDELEIEPSSAGAPVPNPVVIRAQGVVQLEEIPLIQDDPEALAALRLLRDRGYSVDQVSDALDRLEPVPVTKQRQRQAKRMSLDVRVRTAAARALKQRGVNPEGKDLDVRHLGKSNLIVLKSAIDREVSVATKGKKRPDLSRPDLDMIDAQFDELVGRAVAKVFNE